MAKCIMIQGTMSNAGKSFLVAGLCRIFQQDGYRVVPFKSQNMALNSYITKDGLEMGRAQVMQAEACKVTPSVYMNPILLKPTNDMGSQVIVNGKVVGNMSAKDYFAYKKELIPEIAHAYHKLEEDADIIVIEGAGSPAEINLKENDIVNMGLAKIVDAPVLLVGDIDRGGVFAQLYGTYELLEPEEQERIKGVIINKFRGDVRILESGIQMLQGKLPPEVVGVVPYMKVQIEDEDSLSECLEHKEEAMIDIAVIRLPRISNFTDFNVFEQMKGVSVRYITSVRELHQPDLIILPGSKNTIEDLKWLRQSGLEASVQKMSNKIPVWGICGGYQMLGTRIEDPLGVEGGGHIRGMGLLPMKTRLQKEKKTRQVKGRFLPSQGIFEELSGEEFYGYEIHMGTTELDEKAEAGEQSAVCEINVQGEAGRRDGCRNQMVYGSYVHGIFDAGKIALKIVLTLAKRKGIEFDGHQWMEYQKCKEMQYDKMADILRTHMDIPAIYQMMGIQSENSAEKMEENSKQEREQMEYKPDKNIIQTIKKQWDQIAKPLKSLGTFESIYAQIGGIQRKEIPSISTREILVFCSDNGIVEEGISQSGQEVTRIVATNMGLGKSSVCVMAKRANVSVCPVDVGVCGREPMEGVLPRKIREGTRNFLREPAMTMEEVKQAIELGVSMVREKKKEGKDLLAIGEMGIGNTTTSSAVASALLGLSASMTTGRGAGLSNQAFRHKQAVIEQAMNKYELTEKEPMEVLQCVGGYDIATMAGVCIGGARYGVPIILDGVISMVSALVAERIQPGSRYFCIASHRSKEPSARLIEKELEISPVIDAGLGLGEGTGTTLLFSMLDIIEAEFKEQSQFDDYEMEQYETFESRETI